MIRLPALILLVLACVVAPLQADVREEDRPPTVELATLQWEPYVGEYLDNQGFTTEIVRQAFLAAGYQVQVQFTSWSRALAGAASGNYAGAFPAYYSRERADVYSFSTPIGRSVIGFIGLRERSEISYRTLRDLEGLRIGVVKDYVNSEAFDTAEYLTRITAWDDGANINRLLIGRLDLAVIDFHTARYILRSSLPKQEHRVRFLQPPLQEKSLHVIFSPQRPDLAPAFNAGLAAITESGLLAAIYERYGLE